MLEKKNIQTKKYKKDSHSSPHRHTSAHWSTHKMLPCKPLWNWPWRKTQRGIGERKRSDNVVRKTSSPVAVGETHGFWRGETSQRLDGLGDEGKRSRGGGILPSQIYERWATNQFACEIVNRQSIQLTGWWGRNWKRLGERMAGAKKRRKMKLLTAVYRTSWSTGGKRKKWILMSVRHDTWHTVHLLITRLDTIVTIKWGQLNKHCQNQWKNGTRTSSSHLPPSD